MATPEQVLMEKLRALPPQRLAEVADFVEFLRQRSQVRPPLHDFPVDQLGSWPTELSLQRTDLYDDDGR
jgi:hypothetical protein